MFGDVLEIIVQLGLLVFYTTIAGSLAVAGLFIEYRGLLEVLAGEFLLGGWFAVIGLGMVAFGYLVFRDKAVVQYGQWLT